MLTSRSKIRNGFEGLAGRMRGGNWNVLNGYRRYRNVLHDLQFAMSAGAVRCTISIDPITRKMRV